MTAVLAVGPLAIGQMEVFRFLAGKGYIMGKYGNWTRGEDEALLNILGGDDIARAILRRELKVVVNQSNLLKRIAIVSARGATRFVAEDHLKSANVGWTGDNFKKLFLKKTEENVGDAAIAIDRLERASKDAPIMTELGARAEIKLAHFFSLLEAQSKGREGDLAVDGSANIAYIIGNDGNFWAVIANWCSGHRYWSVEADSVGAPHEWRAGHRVFSCDSL